MILCVGATPAVQRTMVFGAFRPGEVNRAAEVHETAAGKAVNVAHVLATLGQTALAAGFAGGETGRFICSELDRYGARHDFIPVAPRTRTCITIVDRSTHRQTELVEDAGPVTAEDWRALLAKVREHIAGAKCLALSGTLPPGGSADFYAQCVAMANERRIPSIVDAKGEVLMRTLGHKPLVIKPNLEELAGTLGLPLDAHDPHALTPALREGILKLTRDGAGWSIITIGAPGAIICDGQSLWRLHSPRVEAVNAIGSGDSFTAGLIVGLLQGRSVLEACPLAAACGAANALTLFTAHVHPEDVKRLESQATVERI